MQFYYYWHPNNNAILSTSGHDIPLTSYVKDALGEVDNLGRTLRFLRSKAVRHIRSHASTILPVGTTEFEGSSTAPLGHIASIQMGNQTSENNAVIGYFDDDYSGEYFMLVNLKYGTTLTASSASQNFTIKLASTAKSLYKMNRDTGRIENIPIVNGTVNISILGGTGELFKVNSSSFRGAP